MDAVDAEGPGGVAGEAVGEEVEGLLGEVGRLVGGVEWLDGEEGDGNDLAGFAGGGAAVVGEGDGFSGPDSFGDEGGAVGLIGVVGRKLAEVIAEDEVAGEAEPVVEPWGCGGGGRRGGCRSGVMSGPGSGGAGPGPPRREGEEGGDAGSKAGEVVLAGKAEDSADGGEKAAACGDHDRGG